MENNNNEQILTMKGIVDILIENNVKWDIAMESDDFSGTVYNVDFYNAKDKYASGVDIHIDRDGVVDLKDYIMLASELLVLKNEQEEEIV